MNYTTDRTDNGHVIQTQFSDILTRNTCTMLVAELIKYILYQKQQLPYTFDRLKYLITRKRSLQDLKTEKNLTFSNVEHLFKIAENGFTTLEVLFEKTKQEMALNEKKVCEIALVFGSTPLTPKQVYHIHLPNLYCEHLSINHNDRKHLLQILQCIIECRQLNEMLMKPMAPTNMFVFIRREKNNSSDNNISSWFLPKNRFKIPTIGQHIHIKFSYLSSSSHSHSSQMFYIYSDDNAGVRPSQIPKVTQSEIDSFENCETQTEWYQACETFKGFKDVFLNGISVSDLWIR